MSDEDRTMVPVVCAWCDTTYDMKEFKNKVEENCVSHGICDTCYVGINEEMKSKKENG